MGSWVDEAWHHLRFYRNWVILWYWFQTIHWRDPRIHSYIYCNPIPHHVTDTFDNFPFCIPNCFPYRWYWLGKTFSESIISNFILDSQQHHTQAIPLDATIQVNISIKTVLKPIVFLKPRPQPSLVDIVYSRTFRLSSCHQSFLDSTKTFSLEYHSSYIPFKGLQRWTWWIRERLEPLTWL